MSGRSHSLAPSGDTTGVTDTAAIQAVIDAEAARAAAAKRAKEEADRRYFGRFRGGKLAVDGHKYQQRQRARRRRRR